ncbi:hypothetical protein C7999DRAFT_31230 [Corynascus novoguineensis]|uniref:Uncharacterized protein n=1 Tax=Corynascus novoguineensis TaxID=1126955 RepID=A0AAN7CTZ8_9PEZI|nr:hypothetical protein C7999DRAFT_31230 [Corynascus novoguineensis]
MLTLRQSCRRLMQVHYYEQTNRVKPEERSGVSGPFIAYDFSGFGNLQSLVLGELHDGLAQWKHRVARILLGTPGLESLELSLSASTVFLCPRYSVKLFDNMCDEYASIGGHPLRLRSLRCGRGIYPMNRVFLSKLTGTSQLEDVQICNAPVNWLTQTIDILYPFDNCHSGIVFDAFGPEHCPNLRRFIVSRYQLNVHEYLCAAAENPGFARRLAFFLEWPKGFGYGEPSLLFGPRERRQDPSRHLALPIQLRAFGVDLERPSISETDRYLWRERVFDDIVTSNADSLKGLLIWIQRLRAHLAEPFGAEKDASDDIEKLARAVGRLPLLRELALVGCWQEEIQDYPGAAQRLAKAVSTLVYVSINEQLWQIQRLHSGEVEVEELEEGEVEDAELFYHYAWRIYRQKLPAQPRPFCISSL